MIQFDTLNQFLMENNCASANKVEWFDEIASTNDYVMALDDYHGAVCVAGLQTAGRGRRGRQWMAPAGSSILMSIGWRIAPSDAEGLSLACGIGVYHALKCINVLGVSLKWPNDVLLGDKKLAGILVELGRDRAVIGVGLNLNLQVGQSQFPQHTRSPWTDLGRQGYHVEYQSMLQQLILNLSKAITQFELHGFVSMQGQWNQLHQFHHKNVNLEGTERVQGNVAGVTENGALILDTEAGQHIFHAGEVSMSPGAR